MIINEQALLRSMKEAKKGAGYHVFVLGRDTMIGNYEWLVQCRSAVLPRKVKALLVEHLGELPHDGDAWVVRKKEVQEELIGVASENMQRWEDAPHNGELRRTPLAWDGAAIAWNSDTNKLSLFDPDLLSLGTAAMEARLMPTGANLAVFEGLSSTVYVMQAETPAGAEEILKCLGGVAWETS